MAVIITIFSPVYLYFIPAFLAAILAIYISGLRTFKDGLLAAFMTYIFSDGILGTIALTLYYLANEPYPAINIDIWIILSPIVSAVTAAIAGYIGVWLVQKTKPAPEPSRTIPQELQTV